MMNLIDLALDIKDYKWAKYIYGLMLEEKDNNVKCKLELFKIKIIKTQLKINILHESINKNENRIKSIKDKLKNNLHSYQFNELEDEKIDLLNEQIKLYKDENLYAEQLKDLNIQFMKFNKENNQFDINMNQKLLKINKFIQKQFLKIQMKELTYNDLIYFKYKNIKIYDPFKDEYEMIHVDPIEYYGDCFLNSEFFKQI